MATVDGNTLDGNTLDGDNYSVATELVYVETELVYVETKLVYVETIGCCHCDTSLNRVKPQISVIFIYEPSKSTSQEFKLLQLLSAMSEAAIVWPVDPNCHQYAAC